MASVEGFSTGQTSGKIIVSGLLKVDYDRTGYAYIGNLEQQQEFSIAANTQPGNITKHFYGLSPGRTYTVGCSIYKNGHWNFPIFEGTDIFTTDSPPRPEPFYWSFKARNAFENKGNFSDLTAAEWNRFIDNIRKIRKWYRPNWDVSELNYCYVQSGQILTANIFNIARRHIGEMYSTGIFDVYKGDIIYGEYFTKLETALNSVQK